MSKKSMNQAYVVKLEQKLDTIKTGYSLTIKSRIWSILCPECVFYSKKLYFIRLAKPV